MHYVYRALELHKEMNENGLELPANELLEFIEVRACQCVLPLLQCVAEGYLMCV